MNLQPHERHVVLRELLHPSVVRVLLHLEHVQRVLVTLMLMLFSLSAALLFLSDTACNYKWLSNGKNIGFGFLTHFLLEDAK